MGTMGAPSRRRPGPIILAHGGAGPRAMTKAQRSGLAEALLAGYEVLRQGLPSLDAVEVTIGVLESSGLFNAGVGARVQLDGVRRMDASLMDGRDLRAGAVAAIEHVRHPIRAARLVMEETAHLLLAGRPATQFAGYFHLERQAAPTREAGRVGPRLRGRSGVRGSVGLFRLMQRGASGRTSAPEGETVGAVALDRAGRLAAGASTGGIGNMLPGRVGDTPLIGSGVYADDEAGAVSMTGLGESIVRISVAKEIVDRLAAGAGPAVATALTLKKLTRRISGRAGALVLTGDGRFAIRHSTLRMAAGYWNGRGQPTVRDRFT